MPLAYSIVSTRVEEDSSGGVSQSNFTTPWSLDLPDDCTTAHELVDGWTATPASQPLSHRWTTRLDFESTTSFEQDVKRFSVRAACIAILAWLPDEALPEISETLRNIIWFYRELQGSQPKKLVQPTSRPARKGTVLQRAPLIIGDD